MAKKKKESYGYGKSSTTKWVLLYIVIGLIVYGAIYTYIKQRHGGSLYSTSSTSGLHY